ncbi:MAG: AAA family ATPase [Leadbetterella sp.]
MEDPFFVGRESEVLNFRKLLSNNRPELVTVIGRRRVGKTYLIKHALKGQLDFHFTGVQDADKESVLKEFAIKISELSAGKIALQHPQSWLEAFRLIRLYMSSLKTKKKKVIFLDELPWLDNHKSGFLAAFEFFWNDWAVDQNILIVVCGSSTSWMLKHIINNKAGLHNRITQYIKVLPFTLSETQLFLNAKGCKLPQYDIIQLYMALGGIPYYLQQVSPGDSAIQSIDNVLFNENSTLKHEFSNLYRALFDKYEKYETIIKALAKKQKGLTRLEIIEATKISNGGGLTRMLNELEESTFIKTYQPFNNQKKETLYRLVDEYSIFYFQFSPQKNPAGSFINISQSPKYKSWAGFAFEALCMKHISKIKHALGISGIYSTENSYYFKEKEDSFQIDLLIDRQDNAINICEAKFYAAEYQLDKKESQILRNRIEAFRSKAKTKKHLIPTLLTTFGLKTNEHSIGLIDKVITMKQLF